MSDTDPANPGSPLRPGDGLEPVYPDDATPVQPTVASPTAAGRPSVRSVLGSVPRRWLWAGGVAVVVIVVALVLTSGSSPTPRGASTARVAAQQFVTALNAGNGTSAAAISCSSFADQARSEAHSGADPGITFTLGAVTAGGTSAATAALTQHTSFGAGTAPQSQLFSLQLQRKSNRWLVCGEQA